MTCLGLRHDPGLLLLALAVGLAASFGVFRIRWRMQGAHGRARAVWVFLAAVEAGAGVWGAQALAFLAFDPQVRSGFDPLGVIGSLLLAVTGCYLALGVAWTGRERVRQATGGALFALTVGAVHYAELGAQRMQAVLTWEPILVWVSAVVGVALAASAVLAAGRASRLPRQLTGAALMTGAVIAIHVLGLAAATLTPQAGLVLPSELLDRTAMLLIAGLLSILMIAAGLASAYIDDSTSRRAVIRSQRLADATREGIAILGADRRILDCNAAFSGLCGLTLDDIRGRDLWSLVTLDDGAESRLDQRQDATVRTADGADLPVAVKLNFVAEQGEDNRPGLIATLTDLREQRVAEARIRFLNEHDVVTGLPNRTALVGRLETALERVSGDASESLVLIEVRVANSQEVNSLLGHAAGDALLAKVAERLTRLAGGLEHTARLGGNAFAFYVFRPSRTSDDDDARLFFERAMEVLRRPFVSNAQVIEPQVRLGVAGVPQTSQDVAELMLHAESALHAPDEEGRDGVFYFRRELHDALTAQRSLMQDLRQAIAADELTVHYQPQARSEDGALCGFEALVRWRHPELGFLPPDRFIGLAEETGLIGALGEWVLRRACMDAMTWPKPVTVAVNLSPLQVGEPGLPARVHEILMETGLPPSRLELEITESALFRNYQRALDTLRRLKALGIRIAMDDFGTGFSSLSTLQSFPFDKIKIDKSFVQGVGVLERSTVIVKAVLGIGRGLAIPVVAEGVETDAQMSFLRDELCATVQGYFIGKPGPVELHADLFAGAPDAKPRKPRAAAAA